MQSRTLLQACARRALRRSYSHGPTVGQVYEGYRKFDEHLARVRPDLVTEDHQIDALLARGEITPNVATHYQQEIASAKEAKKAAEYWRKVFWYVGIPVGILIGANTYYLEKEHHAHLEAHPHEPPSYPHLRIRSKKFFWGDGEHTPFHNPQVNGP